MAEDWGRMKGFYLLVVAVAVIGGGALWYTSQRSPAPPPPAAPGAATAVAPADAFRGFTLGSDSARVEITEYSDFECPFCASFATVQMPVIREQLIAAGKVRWRFRDFPLPSHKYSRYAAQAAQCAGEQGKFWEMHDLLFANQTTLAPPNLTKRAHELGLDEAKFSECLSSGKYRDNIRRSMAGAERMGLNGTPAFLLGVLDSSGNSVRSTKVIMGAESFDTFKAALDELLAAPQK